MFTHLVNPHKVNLYKGETIENIDILLSFYNLQIDPDLSDSSKRILNRRDLRRIKRFLDEYTTGIFTRLYGTGVFTKGDKWNWNIFRKLIEEFGINMEIKKIILDENKNLRREFMHQERELKHLRREIKYIKANVKHDEDIIEHQEEEIGSIEEGIKDDRKTLNKQLEEERWRRDIVSFMMTTTLESYEENNICNWFQSDDIKAFMKDYLMVQRIIDDFQLGRFDYDESNRWLSSLHRELVDINSELLKDKLLVVFRSDSTLQQSKYRDIETLYFLDPNKNQNYGDWHGIGIYHIGQAIYDGLFLILTSVRRKENGSKK